VPREWQLFLDDIVHACEKVILFCEGLDQKSFFEQEMVLDATLRNLTIIGEAVTKIPEDVRQRYADVEWNRIVAFRNVAMHEYFGLDRDIVWDVVTRKVPELLKALKPNK